MVVFGFVKKIRRLFMRVLVACEYSGIVEAMATQWGGENG